MSCQPIHEMPEWLQFNRYVLTGYRRPFTSVTETFTSLFRWHNESVNVWLHLLPALALTYQLTLMEPLVPDSTLFQVCMASCMVILYASSAYHLFMPCCCSRTAYSRLVNCDVLSCLLTITITAFSFIQVGNRCVDSSTVVFATVAMLLSAATVAFAVLNATLTAAGRVKVFGFHCLLRLSIAVAFLWPKVHTHGFPFSFYYHTLSFFVLMSGGFVNGLRVPERWLRDVRWMDYVMNSHNIWHYMCVIALTQSLLGCYYDHVEFAEMSCYDE